MKRLLILALALAPLLCHATDFRGAQFIGFSDFSDFKKETNSISKRIEPAIDWDELVPSWNLRGDGEATFEVRLSSADRSTKWYTFGAWSAAARHSVNGQDDENAKVDTDTLHAKFPGAQIEVRVTFNSARPDDLKFLSIALRNSKTNAPPPLEPNRRAWGKVVEVGTRSQLDYEEGAKIWCSPTSTSMILDYWSKKLNRPEMSLSVPEVARAVYDSVYKGTGNWPCNTAFAGHFEGMRAYVSRLTDVSELEDWIEARIPIATSVSYNRLKGKGTAGSGHLIVCVGFTENGDIVVNDPGTHLSNVRRTFARDIFRQAWADSGNTVYIMYPENAAIPPARFGHWENKSTR